MKQSIILIALILVTNSINAQERIKGNGNITSVTRLTSDYNTVSFAGSFNYVLVSGKEGEIKIEGEENLLEYIITEVKNGALSIKTEKKINLLTSRNQTIKITVPFEDIHAVSLAGSGNVWNESIISTPTFEVSVTGSGEAELEVNTTSLEAKVTGSGDLDLKGKTTDLKLNVLGSGKFEGAKLEANAVDVSVTGSGAATITCSGHLKARIKGSGKIKYIGNPVTKDSKVSGSGTISN